MTQDALTEPFEFEMDGDRLRGDLYLPAHAPFGVVVVTGPLTSVRSQATGAYARALADRGYAALSFDHRYFGASDGQPRQFENPFAKVKDIRAAATALEERPDLTSAPLFAVGVCAGAGYMARAVAEDGRFRAFAGVAGVYGEATPESVVASADRIRRGLEAEAEWRRTGVAPTIPAVAPGNGDVAMPLDEAFAYYGTPRGARPDYVNGFAVQSFAYTARFDGQGAADVIAAPTLVVHSETALAPAWARRFIERLGDRGENHWLTSQGQIDFYDDHRLIGEVSDLVDSFFVRAT